MGHQTSKRHNDTKVKDGKTDRQTDKEIERTQTATRKQTFMGAGSLTGKQAEGRQTDWQTGNRQGEDGRAGRRQTDRHETVR